MPSSINAQQLTSEKSRAQSRKTFPQKFLTAWICSKRKNGHPQLTCNNNDAKVIDAILPADKMLTNKQALLKEWLPFATDENSWLEYIENYFNSCRNINLNHLNPEADLDETEEL